MFLEPPQLFMVNKFIYIWKKINGLFLASLKGFTEIVKALLDKGANIDAKDDSGNTAIIYGTLFYISIGTKLFFYF